MKKYIYGLLIDRASTIKEAMKCIEDGQLGIALIVNHDKKLEGVITDKDIRHALLAGENFSCSIDKIMSREPVVATSQTPSTELLEIFLTKKVHQIPILDSNDMVIDIATLSELNNIPLSSPDITHKEVEIINSVLSSPSLSIGPKIKEFEEKIADYIGTKYAIGVNSGTSGLHLCIRSLDIKDGDEVITSPFSFISSANCVLFERARPVFVDIEQDSLCMDVDKIEAKITSRTKAILPVHIFGQPCKMDRVMEIADKHGIFVLEDACEAIGSSFDGKKVGAFGNAGVFAFYPNKQITTAEGGIVVTNDENIAMLCRSMRNQGRNEEGSEWLLHDRLGYNYRMSELSAALGIVQLDRIEEILHKRSNIANLYSEKLASIESIILPIAASEVNISWFVYVIRLAPEMFSKYDRNIIISRLHAEGIGCRDYFYPIHLEPFYMDMFGYKKGDFPVTESISELTIALPFYNNLQERQIDCICEKFVAILQEYKKELK